MVEITVHPWNAEIDWPKVPPSTVDQFNGLLMQSDTLLDAGDKDGSLVKQDQAKALVTPYKKRPPPPTAAMSAPPEVIHHKDDAIAVCMSPDICKTPVGCSTPPVPYMVCGKAGDDQGYTTQTFGNGLKLKTAASKFTKTYGDEPGVAMGVKSGTVGDVIEPVTHSTNVNFEGNPVIRHQDKCTLNKGNCPGEYIHVKDMSTKAAPDGNDAQGETAASVTGEDERPWYKEAYDWTGETLAEAGQAISAFDQGHGKVVTRSFGGLQAVGGALESVAGAGLAGVGGAASATGVGAAPGIPAMIGGGLLAVNGYDNFQAGLRQLWTGEATPTAIAQASGSAATALGASPEMAQTIENAVGLTQGVAGGVGTAAAAMRAGKGALVTGAKAEAIAAKETEKTIGESSAKTAGNVGTRISKNGYDYTTDTLGRTVGVKGKLTLKTAPRDPKIQSAAGGADRLASDQGGHLVGSRFNGPSDIFNTVAQNQNLNQSAWKTMENSWARALENGKEVFVDIRPRYIGDNLRPDSFVVNYTIDGEQFRRVLTNVAGQKF